MVPPTDSKHLIEDLPCLHCQYNLRGLAAEMACPECGAPVAYSVAGYLPLADFRWLKWVWFGVLLQLASLCAAFLAMGYGWTARVGPPGALQFVSKLLLALGLFLITTPEARQAWLPPPTSLRITVRALAVLSLAGYLLPNAPGIYFLDVLRWGFANSPVRLPRSAATSFCDESRFAYRKALIGHTTVVMTGFFVVRPAGILFAIA